jgi:hypothetical protein
VDLSEVEQPIDRLLKKIGTLACPLCKTDTVAHFGSEDGNIGTRFDLVVFANGKPTAQVTPLRTVSVACANCGYIRQFAVDFLLPDGDK